MLATRAMGKFPDPSAQTLLQKMSEDDSAPVRSEVREVLKRTEIYEFKKEWIIRGIILVIIALIIKAIFD